MTKDFLKNAVRTVIITNIIELPRKDYKTFNAKDLEHEVEEKE